MADTESQNTQETTPESQASTGGPIDDEFIANLVIEPEQKSLDLSNGSRPNTMTNDGLLALCEKPELQHSQVLTSIDLSRVETITTVKPLIDVLLLKNDSITSININGCPNIPAAEQDALRVVLEFNSQPALLKMHLYRMYKQVTENPMKESKKAPPVAAVENKAEAEEAPAAAEETAAAAQQEPAAAQQDEAEQQEAAATTTEEGVEEAADSGEDEPAEAPDFLAPPSKPIRIPRPPRLVELDLDEERSYHTYDDSGVKLLFEKILLPFPEKVHEFRISILNLRGNRGVGPEAGKLIARWLPNTSTLRELDLSGTSIGSDGIHAIASDGLSFNGSVTTVLLDDCGGCDRSAADTLARCLKDSNQTIERLGLSRNGMTADACHNLAAVYRTHVSLVSMSILLGNNVSEDDMRLIRTRDMTLQEPIVVRRAIPPLIRQDEALIYSRPTTEPMIVSLDFSHAKNEVGVGELSDTSVQVILSALRNNTTVTSLDLTNNHISFNAFRDVCEWAGSRRRGETKTLRLGSLRLERTSSELRSSTAEVATASTTPFAVLHELFHARPLPSGDVDAVSVPFAESIQHFDYSYNYIEPGVTEREVYDLIQACTSLESFAFDGCRVLRCNPPGSEDLLPPAELQQRCDMWLSGHRSGKPSVMAILETLILMPRSGVTWRAKADVATATGESEPVVAPEGASDRSEVIPVPLKADDNADTLLIDGAEFDTESIVLITTALKYLASGSADGPNLLPFSSIVLRNTAFSNLGCEILADGLANYMGIALPMVREIRIEDNPKIDDDGVAAFVPLLQQYQRLKAFDVVGCPLVTAPVPIQSASEIQQAQIAERPAAESDSEAQAQLVSKDELAVVPLASVLVDRPPRRVIGDLIQYNDGTRTFRAVVQAMLDAADYSETQSPPAAAAVPDGGIHSFESVHPASQKMPTPGVAKRGASARNVPNALIVNKSQDTSDSVGYIDDFVIRQGIVKYWLGSPKRPVECLVTYSLLDTLKISNNIVREQGLVDLLSLLCGAEGPEGCPSPAAEGVKVVFHLRVLDVSNNLITETTPSPLRTLLPLLVTLTGRQVVEGSAPEWSPQRQRVAKTAVTSLPFLETVNLSYNDFTDATIASMADEMVRQRCLAPSLTNLVVDELPNVDAATVAAVKRSNSLNTQHALKTLMHATADYMAVGPGPEENTEGEQEPHNLWLDFDCGTGISDLQFTMVCEHLSQRIESNKGYVKFKTFRCAHGSVGETGVNALMPLLPLIRDLDLSHNEINSAGFVAFGQRLAKVSEADGPTSTILVAANFSQNKQITGTEAAQSVREALQRNRTLVDLKLDGTGLTIEDRDSLSRYVRLNLQPTLQLALPPVMGCNPEAREIVLQEPIDGVTLAVIAAAIRASPFLRRVDFNGVGASTTVLAEGPAGDAERVKFEHEFLELCDAVANSTTLVELSLRGVGLRSEHVAQLFLKSFANTPSVVQQVDVSGNPGVSLTDLVNREDAAVDRITMAQRTPPATPAPADAPVTPSRQLLPSPIPALRTPDSLLVRPAENAQRVDLGPSVATEEGAVVVPPIALPWTLAGVMEATLDFHTESLHTVVIDEPKAGPQLTAYQGVMRSARRNRKHSPIVKASLIALENTNVELRSLSAEYQENNPRKVDVVPAGRSCPRTITMEIPWAAQSANDDAVHMLCDALEELLRLAKSSVFYTDDTNGFLVALEITEINLSGNPDLTEDSTVRLGALLSAILAYTHRTPSELPLRFMMLRLDHSGVENSERLAASLLRSLRECPYLLLRCQGAKLLEANADEFAFLSLANEEPMRFREMLINFRDTPPASAIFSYFPTDTELEAMMLWGKDNNDVGPEEMAKNAAAAPLTPHRPASSGRMGSRTPLRLPHASNRTPMSNRRQQLHVESQAAVGSNYPAATDHHLRKVRGFKLTDQSCGLLVNRMTTLVAGRSLNFTKLILPNNAITSKGAAMLMKVLSVGQVPPDIDEAKQARHPLTHIDLSNNELDDECLDALLSFLKHKAGSLEHVDLSGNRLSSTVTAPLLEHIFSNDCTRRTLRTFDVDNESALMPPASAHKLRAAARLYGRGEDVEQLGWGILRKANNPAIFAQFPESNRFAQDTTEAQLQALAGHFDLRNRIHSPSAAAMLLSLAVDVNFTRGVTHLNFASSGLSNMEKTGSKLRNPAARPSGGQFMTSANTEEDDAEYYSLCDLLVDFICSSEELVSVDLSDNKLGLNSALMPVLLDAVRLNRTIKEIDISGNLEKEEGQDGVSLTWYEAARIIDDEVLTVNKTLERVRIGPVVMPEGEELNNMLASLKDDRLTLVVEHPPSE